jgi:hypothetical protein
VLHGNWDKGLNGLADFISLESLQEMDIRDCTFPAITRVPMASMDIEGVKLKADLQSKELALLAEFTKKHPKIVIKGRERIGWRVDSISSDPDWGKPCKPGS